jgi:prephenate dehydrogenase
MPTSTPTVLRKQTIAVIGLGQIGGSLLKRLSEARPKLALLAHDRDRRLATKVGRYAEWVTDLSTIVQRSDVIILATPVPTAVTLIGKIAEFPRPAGRKPLLLDTGTVTRVIHAEAAKHKSLVSHAGFHPLAGAEGEGWASSRSDLFVGKSVVVTASSKSHSPLIHGLVKMLGATTINMDPRKHDTLVAEAIGLPHVLAYAAQGLSRSNPLRAGSWASLTRVAASNPEMVAGFLSTNTVEQKRAIARFEKELKRLTKALDDKSGRTLLKMLADRQRTE